MAYKRLGYKTFLSMFGATKNSDFREMEMLIFVKDVQSAMINA
jgi:hypothetical protein